jgi:hypothetical protein
MRSKRIPKLKLSRETLKNLTAAQLGQAVGGGSQRNPGCVLYHDPSESCVDSIDCNTYQCSFYC